MFEILFGAV